MGGGTRFSWKFSGCYLTVVWISKPFVLKSFVFSFFVPVWNSLLNLWLFFMSFVTTSSYVIVSRPCRLTESYLNRASIVCQKDGSKPRQVFWWHYGCIVQKSNYSQTGKTVWTPEIFLECYCVARNKPIACEKLNCKQEHYLVCGFVASVFCFVHEPHLNQIFISVFHYSKNAFTSIENCLEMGNHKLWITKSFK